MSQEHDGFSGTELRERFDQIRELDLAAQMRECVDYLQHPEILMNEFVESFCTVQNANLADTSLYRTQPASGDELVLRDFFAGREICVSGEESFGFTCLASELTPLPDTRPGEADDCDGLDYVGLIAGTPAVPVLGAVQSPRDASAFVLLLRLLTSLAELTPEDQLQRLNDQLFKGALDGAARFDLHLVLWDVGDAAELAPLHQLTRDMADVFMSRVREEFLFPDVLRNIVCLRMDPDDFDGQLEFLWSV